MRAIALDDYGDADVLRLRELPDPPVGPDVVRIRVRGAGLNPVDYKIRQGHLRGAIPHHTPLIPGWDVAGVVDAVGPAVTGFAAGDEVMAYARKDTVQHGTYAELVSVAEGAVARKPASLSFAQAGGLPLAGLTALQMLLAVDTGPGDVVLVHAAAGGVGHLAVQLARALGATRVIGTASKGNHDFLYGLGCEPIEYGDDLPERLAALVGGDGRVDAALDFVGGDALTQSPRLVRSPARHASVVDPHVKEQGGRYVFVRPDGDQLSSLADLADAGRLRVEVAREFPLDEAAPAQRLLEEGHVRGKLVLTLT
ncbi:NADPH:quinone reductase-like Zn-dependent oxidoreductase [Actinoplanes octamycinicus]|uniref:NADPH:quinone reductase-like Zn-dependent oxidoreductase n=1 Tax=Actinoplanes octamycinicus TaxID=135948 RepID=A0A7W7M9L3_9ACTN|nr:NADP-dependent oxidoreductase [Actinoplanes octamycinicus]MBB4741945.1 NADPH:quinone reductase-like Zn-dependent oxidoreductase [Actinoplanes octamycinicus]